MDHINQTTEIVQVVSGVVGLLLIAAIIRAITKRLRFPFTVALVLAGVGLSVLSNSHPQFLPAWHDLELSPALILYVFLPSLIFESAFNLDARQLRENLGPVLALSVPGLLLSTAAIGVVVFAATKTPLPAALLLGAILSATDPVAVIAVFKRLGTPARLRTLVEGESLFNDATSLVLARLVLAVVVSGVVSKNTVASGAIDFAVVFLGGLLTGWALGWVAGYVLGRAHDNYIEITLTTVLAYLSFIVAEHVLHVSGVMATVAAGLAIGGWGRMKVSAAVRSYLEHFWEYVSFVANALIFLMVGLRVDLRALWEASGLLLWVVLALLLSRALVVFGLLPMVERLPGSKQVSKAYQAVIYWGGLRGAVALAIVLSLPRFEQRERFIAVVMGAVLFTLVVNGLTIEPLVRYLGLDRPLLADRLAKMEADFTANTRALRILPRLAGEGLVSLSVSRRLEEKLQAEIQAVRKQLEDLHQGELNDDDQQRALLYMRGLAEERAIFIRLFDQGQLGESAFRQVVLSLESQIDALRDTAEYEDVRRESRRYRLGARLTRAFKRLPSMRRLAERIDLARLTTDYEIAAANYQASRMVLDILDELARLESTPWYIVDKMRRQYQRRFEEAQGRIDQIASRCPDLVRELQERHTQHLLLLAKSESVAEQADQGIIPSEVANRIQTEIIQALRANRRKTGECAAPDLGPIQMLELWPPLRGIDPGHLSYVAVRLNTQTAAEREVIIRQGETGDTMFFVARGVLRSDRLEEDGAHCITMLIARDLFGEGAVLGQGPSSATVTAMTNCSLYALSRIDLQTAMQGNSLIRDALEIWVATNLVHE
jgi:CPA1 family monovalent cation:H+ antiporter